MDHLADIAEGTKPDFVAKIRERKLLCIILFVFLFVVFFLVPLVTYMKSMTFSGQFLLRC